MMGVALMAERALAGLPPEMVQLIAGGGEVHPADDLTIGGRSGVAVDYGHRITLRTSRVERRDVGERLRRRSNGSCRRTIERWIHRLGHDVSLRRSVNRAVYDR